MLETVCLEPQEMFPLVCKWNNIEGDEGEKHEEFPPHSESKD